MKINVDFELGWVHDEDTIDAAVSRKIIEKAVAKVGENVIAAMEKDVDNQMANKADAFLNDVLLKFMDRNIVVTDKWGNEVSRYESVNELLEEKFEAFVTEVVDDNGKTSRQRGCTVSGTPRLEHLVKKYIDGKVTSIKAQINKEIEKYFKNKILDAEKSIRKRTIETYMNRIDFEAGIDSRNKGK